ncbi:MAG: helix-turn-helix domain-containing protein, partial [Acidimicrobiaceae bacterium]|nr:helix-turn-helix domain-containing protein [Acidimicrobiaceae bacterium]
MSLDHMLWAARRARLIDSTAHHVLLQLAAHTNVDGRAWPSIATIARETRLDPRTVRRAIRRLEDAELVKVGHRVGRTPEYVFPNPGHSAPPPRAQDPPHP